jgi:beta-galactosidase
MRKLSFDQGWEFTEATGFAAMFNPQAWQPVTLPHDAMIAKPRTADSPTGNHGGYFPGGVASYRKKFAVTEQYDPGCAGRRRGTGGIPGQARLAPSKRCW